MAIVTIGCLFISFAFVFPSSIVGASQSFGNLFQSGCIEGKYLQQAKVNSTLDNNHPVACAAYCKGQNVVWPQLALKGKECFCFSDTTSFSQTTTGDSCNEACPGQEDNLCGGPNNEFSIYRYGDVIFQEDTIPFRCRTSFSEVPKVSGQATRGRCLHCCVEKAHLPVGHSNIKENTSLPNNFPGTCVAYCMRNNDIVSYIALKDEECICFLPSITSFTTTEPKFPGMLVESPKPNPCPRKCPGHGDHFCGDGSDHYSLYKYFFSNNIDLHRNSKFERVTRDQCVTVRCGKHDISANGADCSTKHEGYCIENNFLGRHKCRLNTTWSDYRCSTGHKDRTSQLMSSFCNNNLCQPRVYWIRAFGVSAPPKDNTAVDDLPNGDWTYIYDDQAVRYTCHNGYSLTGNATRWRKADGSWTGNMSSCVPDTIGMPATTTSTSPSSAPTGTTMSTTITTAATSPSSEATEATTITPPQTPTKNPTASQSTTQATPLSTSAKTTTTTSTPSSTITRTPAAPTTQLPGEPTVTGSRDPFAEASTDKSRGLTDGAIIAICVGSGVAAVAAGAAILSYFASKAAVASSGPAMSGNTRFDNGRSKILPDMERTPVHPITSGSVQA